MTRRAFDHRWGAADDNVSVTFPPAPVQKPKLTAPEAAFPPHGKYTQRREPSVPCGGGRGGDVKQKATGTAQPRGWGGPAEAGGTPQPCPLRSPPGGRGGPAGRQRAPGAALPRPPAPAAAGPAACVGRRPGSSGTFAAGTRPGRQVRRSLFFKSTKRRRAGASPASRVWLWDAAVAQRRAREGRGAAALRRGRGCGRGTAAAPGEGPVPCGGGEARAGPLCDPRGGAGRTWLQARLSAAWDGSEAGRSAAGRPKRAGPGAVPGRGCASLSPAARARR